MPPPVYTWTFYEEHDLVGDGPAFGPVAPFIYVLTDFNVVNGNVLAQVALVGSGGQAIYAASIAEPVGFSHNQWSGRYVLFSGETAYVSTTSALDVTVSGYKLTGPPD